MTVLHLTVSIAPFILSRGRTTPEVAREGARPADRYCHAHLSDTPELYLSLWKKLCGETSFPPTKNTYTYLLTYLLTYLITYLINYLLTYSMVQDII